MFFEAALWCKREVDKEIGFVFSLQLSLSSQPHHRHSKQMNNGRLRVIIKEHKAPMKRVDG